MAGSTSGISPSFLGLSRSSGQVTHVLLTRSRLCPRPKPGSSLHLHVLSTPPAFVLSQDQTLRERLASHPRSTRTRDRGSSVKRRVRQPGSAPYTGAEVTSLGSPSRSRAEAYELERSVVEPGRDPKRTAARQTTSPSSERTCCLVFKDREPLGSCWTVSGLKKGLSRRGLPAP